MMISVNNLKKNFDYYKKEAGLRNSLKNLFHREKLIKEAVKGISFEIEEGEIVGFLGPNGAGKTTTLKMLSGILYPTSGEAQVMGYTPWQRKREFKKKFSIVMGQKNQLWWDLPASESFELNRCMYELEYGEYKKTLNELLELLDVKDLLDVQVRRLSLGERMKMEIIAALIHRPRVIFLDEPTIGLDIISQKKIREFLKYYNQKTKATIILTSHYMNDIEDLCKKTIVINHGSVVYNGSLAGVNDIFGNKKIIKLQFDNKIEKDMLQRFGSVKEHDGFTSLLEVDKADIKEIARVILERFPVLDFNIQDIPLEEGIAELYGKGSEKLESTSKIL
jgi:ABC-2 type transport system ATP-binding protein